jgi:hypothetical protein
MKKFNSDDDLIILSSNNEFFKGCNICNTDMYLMDIECKKPDLICKDCENQFSSNDIILEEGKEACPFCGNAGNIWDLVTFL